MRMALLVLVLGCFGVTSSTPVKARSAGWEPDAVCSQYQASWSHDERHVWERLCLWGFYIGEPTASVTGQFIRDLFTNQKYRDKLNPNGLRISNVKFTSFLNLASLNIPVGLFFEQVDFFKVVNLSGARISGPVSLENSQVQILSMEGTRVAGDVQLLGVVMELKARNLKVEGGLRIRQGLDIELANAQVGGGLIFELPSSNNPLKVYAPYVKVGGVVWIKTDVDAKNLPVNSVSAHFANARISQDLVVTDSNVARLDLNEAEVGGSVQLQGTSVRMLNASGVRISQEFVLVPSAGHGVKWTGASLLDLSNARISRISAPRNFSYWPDSLEMGDAQFNSFVSRPTYPDSPAKTSLKQMPEPDWFVSWLNRATHDRFDPQPYQQIMDIATKSGQDDIHDAVGFAKKERERELACSGRPFGVLSLDCLLLMFSRTVIGYGYHYWQTVVFVIAFVVLGTLAFQFVPTEDKRGLKYGFAYSFDTFIPLIRLRELHYEIDISNWVRYYFYVHKLAGWVAGSFLVAGLGGFTK